MRLSDLNTTLGNRDSTYGVRLSDYTYGGANIPDVKLNADTGLTVDSSKKLSTFTNILNQLTALELMDVTFGNTNFNVSTGTSGSVDVTLSFNHILNGALGVRPNENASDPIVVYHKNANIYGSGYTPSSYTGYGVNHKVLNIPVSFNASDESLSTKYLQVDASDYLSVGSSSFTKYFSFYADRYVYDISWIQEDQGTVNIWGGYNQAMFTYSVYNVGNCTPPSYLSCNSTNSQGCLTYATAFHDDCGFNCRHPDHGIESTIWNEGTSSTICGNSSYSGFSHPQTGNTFCYTETAAYDFCTEQATRTLTNTWVTDTYTGTPANNPENSISSADCTSCTDYNTGFYGAWEGEVLGVTEQAATWNPNLNCNIWSCTDGCELTAAVAASDWNDNLNCTDTQWLCYNGCVITAAVPYTPAVAEVQAVAYVAAVPGVYGYYTYYPLTPGCYPGPVSQYSGCNTTICDGGNTYPNAGAKATNAPDPNHCYAGVTYQACVDAGIYTGCQSCLGDPVWDPDINCNYWACYYGCTITPSVSAVAAVAYVAPVAAIPSSPAVYGVSTNHPELPGCFPGSSSDYPLCSSPITTCEGGWNNPYQPAVEGVSTNHPSIAGICYPKPSSQYTICNGQPWCDGDWNNDYVAPVTYVAPTWNPTANPYSYFNFSGRTHPHLLDGTSCYTVSQSNSFCQYTSTVNLSTSSLATYYGTLANNPENSISSADCSSCTGYAANTCRDSLFNTSMGYPANYESQIYNMSSNASGSSSCSASSTDAVNVSCATAANGCVTWKQCKYCLGSLVSTANYTIDLNVCTGPINTEATPSNLWTSSFTTIDAHEAAQPWQSTEFHANGMTGGFINYTGPRKTLSDWFDDPNIANDYNPNIEANRYGIYSYSQTANTIGVITMAKIIQHVYTTGAGDCIHDSYLGTVETDQSISTGNATELAGINSWQTSDLITTAEQQLFANMQQYNLASKQFDVINALDGLVLTPTLNSTDLGYKQVKPGSVSITLGAAGSN